MCAPGAPGAAVVGFAGRQLANARVVVAVGKQLGLSPRAWVVATATTMAECRLQVLANAGVAESLTLPDDGGER